MLACRRSWCAARAPACALPARLRALAAQRLRLAVLLLAVGGSLWRLFTSQVFVLPDVPGRTIIVGDVHGCSEELRALLGKVSFDRRHDRLIFVGDLVGKGPHPREVVQLARELGAAAVRGNHEHALLRWRGRGAPLPDPLGEVREAYAGTVAELQQEDWDWLAALPYYLRLPGLQADGAETVVVHAGMVPGVPLSQQTAEDLVSMRSLDPRSGKASARHVEAAPWAARWRGPEHVVFGHDARRGLQRRPCATGLDTGAVYGGNLTALLLPGGALASVPARAQYVAPGRA